MRNIINLLLPLLCIVMLGSRWIPSGYAQETVPLEITAIDTQDYPQVRVFVASPGGRLPEPESIEIRDSDTPVTDQATIEPQRVGVAVVIILDLSRSMRGRGMPDSLDRLEDAREQTIEVARALDPQTDMLSVLVFNRETRQLLPFDAVDGGMVENLLNNEPLVQAIPDKPGGPTRQPSQSDYQQDDYAYAALSDAVETGIGLLTGSQTTSQTIQERLPTMQKVLLIFSDSCDDSLQAIHSVRCEVPADLQTRLEQVAADGSLSILSVGVGVDDPDAGVPQPPRVREVGFAYNARFQLLERFAEELPHGDFIQLYAETEEEAAGVREIFEQRITSQVVQRGNQLVIDYTVPTERGTTHEVTVSSAGRQVTATYQPPTIAPVASVRVTELDEARNPVIGVNIERSQDEIAEVAYFFNDNPEPVVIETPPFALDTNDLELETGVYTVTVQVTDLRGQVSEPGDPVQVELVAPPQAAEPDEERPEGTSDAPIVVIPERTWQDFLIDNSVAILVLVVLLFGLTAVLVVRPWQRGSSAQATAENPTSRKTRLYPGDAEHALLVRTGKYAGAQHPIGQLNTYIGADQSRSDIVLDEDYISGQHASIQREGQQLYVVDLGSANGVTVNGHRLQPSVRVPLQEHDQIGIANVILECVRLSDLAHGPDGQIDAAQQRRDARATGKTVTYDEDRHGR